MYFAHIPVLRASQNCVEILSCEDPVLEEGAELIPAHVREVLSLGTILPGNEVGAWSLVCLVTCLALVMSNSERYNCWSGQPRRVKSARLD